MARLFFAIWPPDGVRVKLARLAEDVAVVAEGRPVPAAKIHLTLAFLGEVDEARSGAAIHAARAVRPTASGLVLDRVGSFRQAHVAWAGCAQCDARLAALQGALCARLREASFTLEERAFAPHVTLARRTRRPVPRASIGPIAWEAAGFALVRALPGSGDYENVEIFGRE